MQWRGLRDFLTERQDTKGMWEDTQRNRANVANRNTRPDSWRSSCAVICSQMIASICLHSDAKFSYLQGLANRTPQNLGLIENRNFPARNVLFNFLYGGQPVQKKGFGSDILGPEFHVWLLGGLAKILYRHRKNIRKRPSIPHGTQIFCFRALSFRRSAQKVKLHIWFRQSSLLN